MNFFRQMEDDIKQYGKAGDHSLEYIGINLKDGIFSEYKCYRFTKNSLSDFKIETNPFENHSILKHLDFQKNCDEKTYRISYKIALSGYENSNSVLEQYINRIILLSKKEDEISHIILNINNYIKTILQTEIEPLCVFGGKIDYFGVVHELKAYYQLKIYKKDNPVSSFADTEKYLRIIEFLGATENIRKNQVHKIKSIFRLALANNFEPMMVGIDIGTDVHKIKYYFQINENLLKSNIYCKLRFLSSSEETLKLIKKLAASGLEIKGFTIPYSSSTSHSMVNLYFSEI